MCINTPTLLNYPILARGYKTYGGVTAPRRACTVNVLLSFCYILTSMYVIIQIFDK